MNQSVPDKTPFKHATMTGLRTCAVTWSLARTAQRHLALVHGMH